MATDSCSTNINLDIQDKTIDTEPLNTSDLTMSSDNEETEVSSKNPLCRSSFAGKTLPENRKSLSIDKVINNAEELISNSEDLIAESTTLQKDNNVTLLAADGPNNDEDGPIETESPSKTDQTQFNDTEEERGTHGLRLPLARIRKIMKADPYLGIASQDAVFLIAKATELFIESLASEAYEITLNSKKKTVSRRDIDTIIERVEALVFLEGAID